MRLYYCLGLTFCKMKRSLNRNHYFAFGVLLGLIISFYVPEETWELARDECPTYVSKLSEEFEPHLNLINKPLEAKKPVKNVIRPRYYSSELGIREKLFIGVMTNQESINRLATAFNRTTAHLVNKIKFFINADNVKSSFKLKNIVGFTDTRENLRPFHILKYIADNYLEEFDYFIITTDTAYVNARKLQDLLYHISITFDIYMGQRYETGEIDSSTLDSGQNYCDINPGIIFSSSVIRKIRTNLDWCVRNAVTNSHSVNIGKCVKYSSKINGCQQEFQGIKIKFFQLDNMKLHKDLKELTKNDNFRTSISFYPVTTMDDFYILHAHFSRLHLDSIKIENNKLEYKTYHIANGTIENDILEIRWPLGVPPPSIPESRHDIIPWTFLNLTHIFMPNHETVVKELSNDESLDINNVLNKTIKYTLRKYPKLKYKNIHTMYRQFDPVRGMHYQLHIKFLDEFMNELLKSFDVVKPLGRVEVVPSPYVTESTRIAIIVPTFDHQINETYSLVKHYEKICMVNQDNTFLMLVFLYQSNSPSKGDKDLFNDIKVLALDLSTKYKNDGSRIAWVSIRLPQEIPIDSYNDIMLSSMYGRNEILSLAVTDLALRKIGLDTLVMLGSSSMAIKSDFLNRVRMNTIQGFQIYSPIGFMMYPCNLANFCKECDNCDVSQSGGYFDKINYDVVSFYSIDYVEARKKLDQLVPIIRNDNDISALFNQKSNVINNVVDIFVNAKTNLHILRAIEPNLRFGKAIKNYFSYYKTIPKCPYHDLGFSENLEKNKCIQLASRKQIGDAIVKYEDIVKISKIN